MSLPVKKLKDGINIVISRSDEKNDFYIQNDIIKFCCIDLALKYCDNSDIIKNFRYWRIIFYIIILRK